MSNFLRAVAPYSISFWKVPKVDRVVNPDVREMFFIAAGLLCLVLTSIGWIAYEQAMYGPKFYSYLAPAVAPTALAVPLITGHFIAKHQPSLLLFLVLQYAYACLLLIIAVGVLRLFRASIPSDSKTANR